MLAGNAADFKDVVAASQRLGKLGPLFSDSHLFCFFPSSFPPSFAPSLPPSLLSFLLLSFPSFLSLKILKSFSSFPLVVL